MKIFGLSWRQILDIEDKVCKEDVLITGKFVSISAGICDSSSEI